MQTPSTLKVGKDQCLGFVPIGVSQRRPTGWVYYLLQPYRNHRNPSLFEVSDSCKRMSLRLQ
jgi:hypothetical protein